MNGGLKSAAIAATRKLPARIRKAVVNLGFQVDREHFDRMAHDHSFAPNMRWGLEFARGRGVMPRGIVDIGAFQGEWSLMAHDVWPEARIVMIEANEDKKARLAQVATTVGGELKQALLGASTGSEVTFHVMESGSSVFEEHSPVPRDQRTLQTHTLDSLLAGFEHPDFIKIDVQGYELEVLRGAAATMARVKAILIEIAFLEINEGAPLAHQVMGFMAENGFVAFDILELHRRPLDRAMNQIDILFLRADSPIRADKRHWAQ
ncbi:FkbM family methyltransferase [Sphingomonas nostoxanthinifaciens]|uniref:FkbM family methyltransferase n=1 Tax=Sphingomonas nostoxanthinifaciens TaxID=2872652 RepID=UPI001CC1C4E9|nr:FkbM family methyltransferase [Sphingomonas nostoxanthinifaciens]UAK25264.1 FkbM family methyltransferase [Sphingomonas nostoxanthinifaciens]